MLWRYVVSFVVWYMRATLRNFDAIREFGCETREGSRRKERELVVCGAGLRRRRRSLPFSGFRRTKFNRNKRSFLSKNLFPWQRASLHFCLPLSLGWLFLCQCSPVLPNSHFRMLSILLCSFLCLI